MNCREHLYKCRVSEREREICNEIVGREVGLGRERKKMARELEREMEGGGGGGGEMVQILLF